LTPIKTPARPVFAEPEQKTYGFDEGECDFDLNTYAGPPSFEGLVMPPPPIAPPPANTFAYPPNFETYARAHALRWAQRVLLDEFGEAASGGEDEKSASDDEREEQTAHSHSNGGERNGTKTNGVSHRSNGVGGRTNGNGVAGVASAKKPTNGVHHDSTNWYERIEHVRFSFDVVVNGVETTHECDWASPVPEAVTHMLEHEPIAAFASPALGMYHSEVKTIGHKAEDAALTAAVEFLCEWAVVEREGAVLDPFRDIREMRFVFEVLTKRGKRRTATRTHVGGPNDRMNAFKAAITRVRGW
jgi:hypothetical protein